MKQKINRSKLNQYLTSIQYEQSEIIREARKYISNKNPKPEDEKVFKELYDAYRKTKYKEEFIHYSMMLDFLLEDD